MSNKTDDLKGFNGGHPCPRCGGVNVPLAEEYAKTPLHDGYGNVTGYAQGKRLYRIHCTDCNLSTQQEVNLVRVIDAWDELKQEYSKNE